VIARGLVRDDLLDIRAGIKAGRFVNEATVSQGIVQRLLNALGWPVYDTEVVAPEYSLGTRRADYALCHPPREPVILIEVKQVGQSKGADRQLFEYAFHRGVPMAILTDGQEWNFFLPTEQGDYSERRLYKLDILERGPQEASRTSSDTSSMRQCVRDRRSRPHGGTTATPPGRGRPRGPCPTRGRN
jgi:predicted type IV restriction endonuclease